LQSASREAPTPVRVAAASVVLETLMTISSHSGRQLFPPVCAWSQTPPHRASPGLADSASQGLTTT
ncbi:MAG: hypothetical protein ABL931_05840, partial [Usitatibacteraceae bacterium]